MTLFTATFGVCFFLLFSITTDKLANIRGLERGWVGSACLSLRLAAHQPSLSNNANLNVPFLLRNQLLLNG